MTTTVPSAGPPVGFVLGSATRPEQVLPLARAAEQGGFAELWCAEDYFFTGAISVAGAALAATERIPVGTGIVSAVVRHPALLAMETATLARMFPGRFVPGIGAGHWVERVGIKPKSQLTALRECTVAVKRLLGGEKLTEQMQTLQFDRVRLAYPPAEVPPIYLGVMGPKMLRMAGEVADGTLSSVMAGPEYVRWARTQIAEGQRAAGRESERHKVTVLVMFCVDDDADRARAAVTPSLAKFLAAMPRSPLTDAYGISDELAALAEGGWEAVAAGLRPEWLSELAVSGDPAMCARQIDRLLAAGADSVVLFPHTADGAQEALEVAAADVLPKVTGRAGTGT